MTVYNQISENKTKTFVIMFFFVLIFSSFFFLLGKYFDSPWGYFFLGFFISLFSSIGSYFYGDKLVLMTTGAQKADKKTFFNFFCNADAFAPGRPAVRCYCTLLGQQKNTGGGDADGGLFFLHFLYQAAEPG